MDDAISITLGATTVGLLIKEALSFAKARMQKTRIEPQPLAVQAAPEFVTRKDFERHVADNAREHENIFSRMNRNDRETSEIKGMLAGMRDDLSAIKNKLFKTRGA